MNVIPHLEEIRSEEEFARIYLVKLRKFLALWREDVKVHKASDTILTSLNERFEQQDLSLLKAIFNTTHFYGYHFYRYYVKVTQCQ